jgi:hypothetical protein
MENLAMEQSGTKKTGTKKISWAVWVAVGLSAAFFGVLGFIKLVIDFKLQAMFGWGDWTDLALVAMDLVFVAPTAGVFWIIGAVHTILLKRKRDALEASTPGATTLEASPPGA